MRIAATCFTMALLVGVAVAADHTKDTPAEVKKAVEDKKAVLIDVREQKEWDDGHLKLAGLLPLSLLKKGVPDEELEKKLPKGKVVYLHCKSGGRVLPAAELLQKKGYDVRPLKQGYEDLLKEGFEKAEKK